MEREEHRKQKGPLEKFFYRPIRSNETVRLLPTKVTMPTM
jgi:hypothetical protein